VGYNLIEPALPGGAEAIKNRAIAAAFSSDPIKGTPDIAKMSQAIAMLEQGMSIEQVAVALNSPGLAAMAKTSQNANTALAGIYAERAKAVKESQTNQLAGASANLNALNQANLPPSAGSPNLPRRAVNTALTQEQNALAAQQTARAEELAKITADIEQKAANVKTDLEGKSKTAQEAHGVTDPNQMPIGNIISGEAKTERQTAKTENKRLYDVAFTLAGDAKINVAALIAKAEAILERPLSSFDPSTAPPIVTRLLKLKNEPPPTPETGGGGFLAPLVSKKPQAAAPAVATLDELDAIRASINSAVRDAKISANADPRLRSLTQLQDEITNAVKNSSTLTPETKAAYAAAVKQYKDNYVPKFKTGVQENLFRRTNANEGKIKPEDVTQNFFKGPSEATQFVAMLGDNPTAVQALKTGIEGLYFSQVAKKGVLNTDAHTSFMFTNRAALDVLDKAGMGISDRLRNLGGNAAAKERAASTIPGKVAEVIAPEATELAKATAANTAQIAIENTALADATKGLKFRTVGELRKSVVKDEATMNQALRRMDDPAKAALARGVMQDVKTLAELTANEKPIMAALRAADPATATRIMANAKEAFKIRSLIEEAQKTRPANALGAEQRVADLTQGLPQVRAAVQKIQAEIDQSTSFDKLAAKGVAAGGGVGNLATESVGPAVASLSHEMSMINFVMRRLKGLTDDKLAAQIGVELANSPSAAAMIAKAQAKAQPKAPTRIEIVGGGAAPRKQNMLSGAVITNQLSQQQQQSQ